jgi:periplasmic protein TonB
MPEPAVRAGRFDRSFPPSPSYTWEIAGKPVVVGLSLELIDSLERAVVENFRSLNSRGSEIGGILLGTVQSGSPWKVSVEGYELVSCEYSRGPLYRLSEADAARFERAVEQHRKSNTLQVIGFFRSHTRKGLGLDTEDLVFFNRRFRDPHQVALLIRPYASKASTAGIFVWEDGAVRGEASYREFPFRRSELERGFAGEQSGASETTAALPAAGAVPPKSPARGQIVPIASRREITLPPPPEPIPAGKAEPPAPAPEAAKGPATKPAPQAPPTVEHATRVGDDRVPSSPVPPASEDSHPIAPPVLPAPEKSGSVRWKWIVAASAAGLLLLSGTLVYSGMGHKTKRTPASALAHSALALRVERAAGELLLSWNRDSEAIQNAARATLSIVDGDQRENVDLDLAQLRNGSIVYSASSSDVVFQLSVTGKDSSRVQSESVRVLKTRPSPMPGNLPAVKPAPPAFQAGSDSPNRTVPPDAETAENPPAEEPTIAKSAPKPFQTDSLAERLRPARPSDLPEAPLLNGAEPGAAGLGGVTLMSSAAAPPPAPPQAVAVPPVPSPTAKIGGQVRPAEVVSRTNPDYPLAARQAHLQGVVVVVANVGADGRVESARALNGPPLLQGAAVAAVKQWIYRPATLNGSPVESETRVELNFTLDH